MALFKGKKKAEFDSNGLVLFEEVQSAMMAEKVLKEAEYQVKLVAPPPQLRKGCDLAVAINLVEQPGIEWLLKEKSVSFISISPMNADVTGMLEIVNITDYGRWLMVKAGNMKLTFDRESGEIVNTSGGGCPDIPMLNAVMTGKKLTEAPRPRDAGLTLCALMLHRAFEESLIIWNGDKR